MRTKKLGLVMCSIIMILAVLSGIGGAFAVWIYPYDPAAQESTVSTTATSFKYGFLYITETAVTGGDYQSAALTKTGDTTAYADINLKDSTSSTAVAQVTFYNSTDVSYYYDKTEKTTESTLIDCNISGIAQKDEIPSKTYKTITVTFDYNSDDVTDTSFTGELIFKFTIDKDSIGNIVAQTVTEKFEEVLNNEIEPDAYQTLTEAMDERGTSSYNAASSVTYIGNVAGADTGDSQAITDMFGEDAFAMDLDGDGNAEPITMMIKRENVDNDVTTGDYYTYQNWRGEDITVNGVEMTIYITAEDFSNTNRGDSIVVYAAVFTRYSETDNWVQIVPLTKGTADANNYEGSFFGEANSFNTDTWRDENNNTIETVVNNAINYS